MEEKEKSAKIEHHVSPWGFLLGLGFVIFGILELLNTFGLVKSDFIEGMWRLWPLILIYIGIDMMSKNKFLKAIIFTIILLLGFITYWLWYQGLVPAKPT